MNEWAIGAMRRIHAEASRGVAIDDGLVRYDRPGHTRQVAHLPYCHEGRYSAGYYALETLLGHLGKSVSWPVQGRAERGMQTLRALASLQIRDAGSEHYGAFRWYAEEKKVQDSNAAFFILMPLVSLRLRAPEAVPEEHSAVIDEMLRHAAVWFERECREPELYYPNKTMSDGAMLLAVAHLLEDRERLQTACDYFERWESYTARRGWGWGENMSLVYQGVMLNALEIAEPLLRLITSELAERLNGHRQRLLDLLRFHDGREFVPAIRSYNFGGEVRRQSLAWLIAGVTGTDELADSVFHVNDFPTLLLFEKEFRRKGTLETSEGGNREISASGENCAPRVREERVFDGVCAYSWIGRRTRLGSLNDFPVIPGSYQHETWGLGWQSFPLSAAAENGQVSYARWYVDDGETVRTHPAESYKTAYLMPSLFGQRPYPDVRTHAAQSGHALLALRVLTDIRQHAAEIADEWVVHGYEGEAAEIEGGDGRLWSVLRYPGAAIAIAPLKGIAFSESVEPADSAGFAASAEEAGSKETTGEPGEQELHPAEYRPAALAAVREAGGLKLRRTLYAGNPGTLVAPRLESGWAVLCLDDAEDEAAVRARLGQVVIEDEVLDDREVPRDPHERIRRVRLLEDGREQVLLQVDPHEHR